MSEAGIRRSLLVYSLAWAGTAIAYVPFLTILLPVQVAGLAGNAAVGWLAWLSFGGALAASLGHIGFGWLSDLAGNRRGFAAAGLLLSCLLLLLVPMAHGLPMLLALIIAWQLALNLMMAPLAALAADVVPDAQKGLLGGLLAFAPALGALSGSLVTLPALASGVDRLAIVVVLVVLCVTPVLLWPLPAAVAIGPSPAEPIAGRRVLRQRMWLARLLVQIAEATLFAYLYIWFRQVDPVMDDNRVASLFAAVLLISVPLALLVGHWADRRGQPFAPLAAAAGGAALGLAAMAASTSLTSSIAAFCLFGLASALFLALHAGQTLRVLPRPDRRGRDLGLFNLTNTIPSLIMPWLALGMVPQFGFSGLFLLLALLAGVGASILMGIARPVVPSANSGS